MEVANYIDASIEIPLPFCLYLNDGIYPIKHEGCIYNCHLRKEWTQLVKDAKDNSKLNPNGKNRITSKVAFNVTTGKTTICENMELRFDKRGTFRYSVFEATLKFTDYQKIGGRVETIPTDVLIDKALCLINKLVEAYRLVTGEFYITKIGHYDLVQFRGAETVPIVKITIPSNEPKSVIAIGYDSFDKSPFTLALPDRSKEEHSKIKELLLQDFTTPIEKTLILNAKDYTHSDKYEVAVFNLGTALEVSIDNYLSNTMTDKEIRYLHFEQKYDSALKSKSLKNADDTLWQMLKKIWNIRNNIAHRGKCVWTDNEGRVIEQIDSEGKVNLLIKGTERIIEYIKRLSENGEGG